MSEKPELSKLLTSAGYCPRVAKALAWLILNGKEVVTSREIERGADLRQPEVHYAIIILTGSEWIEKVETPPLVKRGRPFIQYRLKRNKEQAFAVIKGRMDAQAQVISTTIDKIHDAIFPPAAEQPEIVAATREAA